MSRLIRRLRLRVLIAALHVELWLAPALFDDDAELALAVEDITDEINVARYRLALLRHHADPVAAEKHLTGVRGLEDE